LKGQIAVTTTATVLGTLSLQWANYLRPKRAKAFISRSCPELLILIAFSNHKQGLLQMHHLSLQFLGVILKNAHTI